jgi:hypothetical protein
MKQPISELDVSAWERCTTSYVHLPGNYPRLRATGRSALNASVLQDEWVSVTTGSEDFSFKVWVGGCFYFLFFGGGVEVLRERGCPLFRCSPAQGTAALESPCNSYSM